jgi:hypothetical protein
MHYDAVRYFEKVNIKKRKQQYHSDVYYAVRKTSLPSIILK